jgi:hypothetical protein
MDTLKMLLEDDNDLQHLAKLWVGVGPIHDVKVRTRLFNRLNKDHRVIMDEDYDPKTTAQLWFDVEPFVIMPKLEQFRQEKVGQKQYKELVKHFRQLKNWKIGKTGNPIKGRDHWRTIQETQVNSEVGKYIVSEIYKVVRDALGLKVKFEIYELGDGDYTLLDDICTNTGAPEDFEDVAYNNGFNFVKTIAKKKATPEDIEAARSNQKRIAAFKEHDKYQRKHDAASEKVEYHKEKIKKFQNEMKMHKTTMTQIKKDMG